MRRDQMPIAQGKEPAWSPLKAEHSGLVPKQSGSWLNSNKGTKRDMAISLSPFDRLDFRTLGYPQNGAPFSPPILGVEFRCCLASFSSEKSYSPSRLRCCQATAEPWPPQRG